MLNILFWNIDRKPLYSQIAAIAHEHNVDLIALAESDLVTNDLLEKLKKDSTQYYYAPRPVPGEPIQIFTKFDHRYLRAVKDENRYTIRHLNIPHKPDILVVVVHLVSKLRADENQQQLGTQNLLSAVEDAEEKVGHDRTILVGDFNMNPFEAGLVNAGTGLHAVMSRRRAEKSSRTIDGQQYKFFYNPMWRLMGDETHFTPGTYHYTQSSAREYFWHTFDQFMVRPSLMEILPNDQPQIISSIGNKSLLNANGTPDRSIASDHLPIFASFGF